MKKTQFLKIADDSEVDMDIDDDEDQQIKKAGQKKSDNDIKMTPTKSGTTKAHDTHRKPTPPIEISEAGSPLPTLTPSPPAEVTNVAVKPRMPLRSVRPEPVPGLRYIHKTTLQGSLISNVSGPATLVEDNAKPVCYLTCNCTGTGYSLISPQMIKTPYTFNYFGLDPLSDVKTYDFVTHTNVVCPINLLTSDVPMD